MGRIPAADAAAATATTEITEHDGGYPPKHAVIASSLNVSYGQHVNQGDVIGYVGSTGWSTGYHLHLEIRVNGSRVTIRQGICIKNYRRKNGIWNSI